MGNLNSIHSGKTAITITLSFRIKIWSRRARWTMFKCAFGICSHNVEGDCWSSRELLFTLQTQSWKQSHQKVKEEEILREGKTGKQFNIFAQESLLLVSTAKVPYEGNRARPWHTSGPTREAASNWNQRLRPQEVTKQANDSRLSTGASGAPDVLEIGRDHTKAFFLRIFLGLALENDLQTLMLFHMWNKAKSYLSECVYSWCLWYTWGLHFLTPLIGSWWHQSS